MKREKARKNGGFTLIELVVVIAIIGVLAAVVSPKIRLSLMKSRDAKAVATLDALRTATNVYYSEQGKLPSLTDKDDSTTTVAADTAITVYHVKTLRDAGYLDEQAAKKLIVDTTLADTDDIPPTPVGVSQLKSVECEDPNTDGIYTPKTTAKNTPGYVQYVWLADGVGLRMLPSTDAGVITTTQATIDDTVDTACQVWSDK